MRIIRLAACILGSTLLAAGASAQNFVEIRQDATLYNFRKTNGVPLSSTVGVPPGSDGRIPVTPPEGETANPATTNQFQGLISFGGLAAPTNAAALIPSQSYVGNARSIGLPHATSNGVVVLVLRSARLGSPFLNRQVSFQFGAAIPVPSVDANGATLTNVAPVAYWSPEPHSTNEHAGAGYYWSRHARLVFAIQPGPVDLVWKKAAPGVYTGEARPSDWSTNAASYFVEGANYSKLYPVRYIASGSAVKSPQKMYWTEATFRDTGKPVDVPATRISTVKIVYNNYFPETVAQEYVAEGQSLPTDATNTFLLRRTPWYDTARAQLLAYNAEGRVFVELLGDTRPDGLSKEHLGFEIVDVMKQPKPAEVTMELGDLVRAYPDGRDDSALFPANRNSRAATPAIRASPAPSRKCKPTGWCCGAASASTTPTPTARRCRCARSNSASCPAPMAIPSGRKSSIAAGSPICWTTPMSNGTACRSIPATGCPSRVSS